MPKVASMKRPAVGPWGVVGLLFLALVLSYIDRLILTLFVEQLKQDLHLSDTQISLLQGLAFAFFFAVMSLPLSYMADKVNRKWLLIGSLFLWSMATALSAFAQNFGQLFVARMLVGLGEAALGPIAVSMLADLFSRDKLARALGVYGSGSVVGSGIALLAGGALLLLFADAGVRLALGLGTFEPWRATYLAVGLPGILLVTIIALLVREPLRRPAPSGSAAGSGIMAYLKQSWAIYFTIFLTGAIYACFCFAFYSWVPTFLIRKFSIDPSDAGFLFGTIMLCTGIIGAISGGVLCDYIYRRGRRDAPIFLLMIFMLTAASLVSFIFFLDSLTSTLIGLTLVALLFSLGVALPTVAPQYLAPDAFRGRIAALNGLGTNVVGIVFGPLSVALLTDRYFGDTAALPASLAIALAGFALLAAVCAMITRRVWARFDRYPATGSQ